MPWGVTRMVLDHGMLVRLPLQLAWRSEPYEVVTRSGGELSRPAQMLGDILMRHPS